MVHNRPQTHRPRGIGLKSCIHLPGHGGIGLAQQTDERTVQIRVKREKSGVEIRSFKTQFKVKIQNSKFPIPVEIAQGSYPWGSHQGPLHTQGVAGGSLQSKHTNIEN